VIAQAVRSAALNVALPPDRKHNPKYRLLIIFLHLMQPAARLYGRISHGLTPWRKRGAGVHLKYLFSLRPRVLTHWSESWRSSEDWLSDIEMQLISLDLGVRKGGNFNRWDLQVIGGLFARCRCLLTIEEHGANRQFLRLKCRPVYTLFPVLLLLPLAALTVYAAFDRQWIICGIFSFVSSVILLKIFTDASNAMHSTEMAFGELSDRAPIRKIQRRFKEVDTTMEYQFHNYVPDAQPALKDLAVAE
jgi:hypothetical protein